tara:strand:+ start:371 stop:535 length:165 start_codon:yes stop_codon:yes gene_type:complete
MKNSGRIHPPTNLAVLCATLLKRRTALNNEPEVWKNANRNETKNAEPVKWPVFG